MAEICPFCSGERNLAVNTEVPTPNIIMYKLESPTLKRSLIKDFIMIYMISNLYLKTFANLMKKLLND
jgi:hypothetical protein